jgi:nucleoside recognition membrane protein YjiH
LPKHVKCKFFVTTFAAFDKNSVVKNKFFLFAILIACFVALVFIKPVEATGISMDGSQNRETEISCITEPYNCMAILCETTNFNFSARTVTTCNQAPKTFERLGNILSAGKNFKIEVSVENYIFGVESLAYYLDNFAELRRLNI